MKPNKIIIMRHGESWEDIAKTIYDRVPNLEITLTPQGERQASRTSGTQTGKKNTYLFFH